MKTDMGKLGQPRTTTHQDITSARTHFWLERYPVVFLCLENTFESEQTDIRECCTDLAKQFQVDLIKIVLLFF